MKISKALRDVWKWKEKVYEETKNMSTQERRARSRKIIERMEKEYGLHLKTIKTKNGKQLRVE